MIAAARNSAGSKPKRQHPLWPLVTNSSKPSSTTTKTTGLAVFDSEKNSIRFSSDSESTLKGQQKENCSSFSMDGHVTGFGADNIARKDTPSSTTKQQSSSFFKKLTSRTTK